MPPKVLLDKPPPPNLWVVPACEGCNSSFKRDDEYTASVLAVDIRANFNYAAQVNIPIILRSLQKPAARGFSNYLSTQGKRLPIVTSTGMAITGTVLDNDRINHTGRHIALGLYFRQFAYPLPSNAKFRIGCTSGLHSKHPHLQEIARFMAMLPDHQHDSAGTAFSYYSASSSRYSIWLMCLYDFFFWSATVDKGDEEIAGGIADATP